MVKVKKVYFRKLPTKKLKVKYEDKYVAFIDVLGFKEKLNGSVNDLEAYFQTVLDEIQKLQTSNSKKQLDFILLSDAIILTFPKSNSRVSELAELCIAIGKIQWRLCQIGFWLRGAITFGKIFIDRDRSIVVGPALAQAYKLEGLALQPRVILDPKILGQLGKNRSTLIQEINQISQSSSYGARVLFHSGVNEYNFEILDDAIFVDYLDKLNFCPHVDGSVVAEMIGLGLQDGQQNYTKYRWLVAYALASLRRSDDEEHYLLYELILL